MLLKNNTRILSHHSFRRFGLTLTPGHIAGEYHLSNGEVYTGDWSKGKMQGIGILTSDNGDVYEGTFAHKLCVCASSEYFSM